MRPDFATRFKAGTDHPRWNGGKFINHNGYALILCPGHPKANEQGYVFEHILICEKALGKYLPPGSEPHHNNGKKSDNRPSNLVLCQDRAYHMLLEQRKRSLIACGHASWRKCWICKKYDPPEKLYIAPRGKPVYHKGCTNQYHKELRQRRKQNV